MSRGGSECNFSLNSVEFHSSNQGCRLSIPTSGIWLDSRVCWLARIELEGFFVVRFSGGAEGVSAWLPAHDIKCSKLTKGSRMTGAKFDIKKFDGTGDLGLWRIKMRALLIQHGCEAALEVLLEDMEA
ncbi:hypothetical protein Tco_0320889 [Tanacetum coccineum]